MDLVRWNDSFSVNVVEIDQQHKELIKMFNQLATAIQEKKEDDTLEKTLDDLINYAEEHFKIEETYFAQFGYPEEESHREEHLTFVLKVLDYKDKLNKEGKSLSIDVFHFLWNWFKNHIKVTDMQYSQFFNDNGLK